MDKALGANELLGARDVMFSKSADFCKVQAWH